MLIHYEEDVSQKEMQFLIFPGRRRTLQITTSRDRRVEVLTTKLSLGGGTLYGGLNPNPFVVGNGDKKPVEVRERSVIVH